MKAAELLKRFNEDAEPSFLPAILVMVDLEMSGVIPERDDVLQIAMIKLNKDETGLQYEVAGEPLEIFLHSDKTPSNAFQREFLTEIMAKANASDIDAEQAAQMVAEWLGDWKGFAVPVGDAIQCDLAFLYEKGIITRGDIVNDQPVPGTFNHEIVDLNGLKLVAREKMGSKETLALNKGIHNALVDCQNQLMELNAYLAALLG